jgi:hypothetical protein
MAISVSGRIVKCRPKRELKRIDSKKEMRGIVEAYNHFRIQFSDGSDRHFLFTDKQIEKGIEDAAKTTEAWKISWVKELWYEGLMNTASIDFQQDIEENELPAIARRVNHIRVNLGQGDIHLILSDGAVRSALSRARKIESVLPKVSWLSDKFEDQEYGKSIRPSEQEVASQGSV